VLAELERAALARLETEQRLSADAIRAGGDVREAIRIVQAWAAWYGQAARTVADLEASGASAATRAAIQATVRRIEQKGAGAERALRAIS
jgi:hypothetical protein